MNAPPMSQKMREWVDRAAEAVVAHMNGAPLEVIPFDGADIARRVRGCLPGRFREQIDEKARP